MSRHRNVRSLNYSDECEGYDDVYGHSVEDDYSISPSVAEQFMYDRTRESQMSAFFREEAGIAEEDEEEVQEESSSPRRPQLSDVDEARLQSCLDEIRNVVGDSAPEHVLVNTILRCGFDMHRALDQVLNAAAEKEANKSSQKDVPRDKDDIFHLSNSTEVLGQRISQMHVSSMQNSNDETVTNDGSLVSQPKVVKETDKVTKYLGTEKSVPQEELLPTRTDNLRNQIFTTPPMESTQACGSSLMSLMSKHLGAEKSVPQGGSLFSLMANHKNSISTPPPEAAIQACGSPLASLMSKHLGAEKCVPQEGSLFSLMAKHKNPTLPLENEPNTKKSMFPSMENHNSEATKQTDVLPPLFSLMSQHQNNSSKNEEKNFSTFADLSAYHLKNTSSVGQNSFPDIGFLPKENLQPIDLTCAIKSNTDDASIIKTERKRSVPKAKRSSSRSILVPQVSNFHLIENMVVEKNPALVSRDPSQLGKVLCRCWSRRTVPYIDPNPTQQTVHRFVFNTPSPDDLILRSLNKNVN